MGPSFRYMTIALCGFLSMTGLLLLCLSPHGLLNATHFEFVGMFDVPPPTMDRTPPVCFFVGILCLGCGIVGLLLLHRVRGESVVKAALRLAAALAIGALPFIPLLLFWVAILFLTVERGPTTDASNPPPDAPNPAKAPYYFFGPSEVLVGADPSFSGVLVFWYYFWLPTIAIVDTLAIVVVLEKLKKPCVVALAMLAVGLAFAAPWIYGLIVALLRTGY